jgi:creatinine amidohydrolase
MEHLTRRDVLLSGLALAGSAASAAGQTASTAREDTTARKAKRFEEVAGFELADVVAAYPIAILPLGSLEFHGPHNPLGSDAIIISGIAEGVAARTRGLLFPTVTFTQCPAHTAHFRGTLSVRPEVMTMYFADILRNILHLGFQKVLLLNGHDGNIGSARGALAQVADETKTPALMFVSWWEFVPTEKVKGLFQQANGGHGHGGPLETSAVAAFRPDLVHLDKAQDLPAPPDLSGGTPYFLQKSTATEWPGYSGHVSEASAEKGRRLVQMSEDAIVQLVENWLSHADVPGSW